MRARTSVGEILVSGPDRDWLFRPSLAAMENLGAPIEIVELFAFLNTPHKINPVWPEDAYRSWERKMLGLSYDVLAACCDDDCTALIGHAGSRYGSYVPGLMSVKDMHPLALCLLKHGLVGTDPIKAGSPKKGDYKPGFDAKAFVAQAVAHLGMSSTEAWNMTMTEFTAAMKAKFGEPENKTPTLEEHDEGMARLAAINRLRDKGKK